LGVTTSRRSTEVEDVVRVSVQDLSPPWHAWLGLAQSGVKLRGKVQGSPFRPGATGEGKAGRVNNRESLMMPRYCQTLGRAGTPGFQGPCR
jgi:hypothetical protein